MNRDCEERGGRAESQSSMGNGEYMLDVLPGHLSHTHTHTTLSSEKLNSPSLL